MKMLVFSQLKKLFYVIFQICLQLHALFMQLVIYPFLLHKITLFHFQGEKKYKNVPFSLRLNLIQ